jgi:hypothetical protein
LSVRQPRFTRLLAPFVALGVAATLAVALPAAADDPTVSYDNTRTGLDPNEAALSPGAVSSSDFGTVFKTALPKPAGAAANQIYAQPIVAGGMLVVATEENQVHGLDPVTGTVRWTTTLGPSWPASVSGCGDLTPDIGITSTPVYDPSTNTVYAMGKVNDGPDVHHPQFKLAAIDATTGAMRPGWPVVIAGAPTNDRFRSFDAVQAGQRAGLLLMGGRIYAGFASHCSYLPYVGYVAGVDAATRAVSLWTTEAGSTSSGGGVWQSGGGLVSDGPGRILFATGNGFSSASPPVGPGTSPPATLAESVVRLQVAADGTMTAQDFFSPVNNPTLDQNDTDLGSGGPAALPDSFGTPSHPHLLIQVGKDGRVFLLDRDDLGGTGQGTGGSDAYLSAVQLKGVWGHPAVWSGDGGYVYIDENSGNLRALRVLPDARGVPILSVVGASPQTFGYTSGSPIVTSDGSRSGSALVWVVQTSGPTGVDGRLLAYDAVPVNGTLHLRYSASIGTVAKFTVVASDAGRVYVATRDGYVWAFGRPTTQVLAVSPTDFGPVAVKSTISRAVTLTAQSNVTVTAVSTDAPFTAGAPSPALPVTLSAGQSLTVPVVFGPTTPTTVTAQLRVTTAAAGTVLADLIGTGTAPGLAADPPSVDFGSVATGSARQSGVSVRNTGTDPITITSVHGPDAPFTVIGAPRTATVVAPGATVTFTVAAQPTISGRQSSFVRVFWSTNHLTIPVSVTGVDGTAHLSLAPTAIDFGRVPPGGRRTLSFDIANTGTAPVTLTKAAPPAAPFHVDNPVPEGTTLAPGQVIHQTVTVYPQSALPASGTYAITADDGQGEQGVSVMVNSTPPVGPITLAGLCVTATDPTTPSSGSSTLQTCSGATTQQGQLPGDGTVSLAGACLNAVGITAGSAVNLRACANIGNQKWAWSADQTLVNRKSGLCLSAGGSQVIAGSSLVLHSCAAVPARQFDLSAITAARGFVSAFGGTLCVDARQSSNLPGTTVQTWTCNGTAAQKVTMAAGVGTAQLLGSCLQSATNPPVSAARIQLAACSGQARQQWVAQPDGTIVNPATGLCLDIPGARTTPGQPLQAWTCNGTTAQRWSTPT